MRLSAILAIFLFLFNSVSAQELDINKFRKGKKVKVKYGKSSRPRISLDEKRVKQKGIIISVLYSPAPIGQEIKLNYTDESLTGFGFYLGYGSTYTFTSTREIPTSGYFTGGYIPDFFEVYNDNGDYYYDEYFDPHPYISLGVSKNFKLKHTLYTGYGRILGVERDEGTGIFDGTTQGYEELHIIDFGYIFKTKSIALTIGLPLHLPRYKYEEYFEGSADYEDIDSGAKFRPQIGIGYIL